MSRLLRTLVAFLVRTLAVVALLGTGAAVTLWMASSALPDLSSASVIEGQLKQVVEGARQAQAQRTLRLAAPFVVDDDLFLAPAGKALLETIHCPGLNGAPPEPLNDFRLRLVRHWLHAGKPNGPGRCELELAEGLATFLGLEGSSSQRILAASRVREALPHHLLLADWASALPFTPQGPFGLDEASRRLFGKDAQSLDWNEAALLALAADNFDEVETCRYPPRLQSQRDPLLDALAQDYPDQAKEMLKAKAAKLPCARPPPPTSFAKSGKSAGP